MLSEQEQIRAFLRPFQALINKYEFELQSVTDSLTNNDELVEKTEQLKKGKAEVEEFIQVLIPKLKLSDTAFKEVVEELEPDRLRLTAIFNEVHALYNYKYSVVEKNELNKRMNALNSSRRLSNDEMGDLQKRWSVILGMPNDKKLVSVKKTFEDRLAEWENVSEKR